MGKVMKTKFSTNAPRKSALETLQFSNSSLTLKLKKLELFYMFNNLCKRKTLLNRKLTLAPLKKQNYEIF